MKFILSVLCSLILFSCTKEKVPPTFLTNGQIILSPECGKSNGIITIEPRSGIPPFQYSIDGGATYYKGPDLGMSFYVGAGVYHLVMIDSRHIVSNVVEKKVVCH